MIYVFLPFAAKLADGYLTLLCTTFLFYLTLPSLFQICGANVSVYAINTERHDSKNSQFLINLLSLFFYFSRIAGLHWYGAQNKILKSHTSQVAGKLLKIKLNYKICVEIICAYTHMVRISL